ncbi:MAG: ATP-binding protein, partial [Caldimonas sp.]
MNAATSNHALADGLLGSLIRSHPVALWLFDPQWLNFIAVNDAAVRQYGYAEDEFLRLTVPDLLAPQDIGRFLRSFEPQSKQAAQVDRWRHVCRDGHPIWVDSRMERLDYRGHPVILAVVDAGDAPNESIAWPVPLLDGSNVRSAPDEDSADRLVMREVGESIGDQEADRIRSRTKTEFLARLSHELRTPLNAVIGFSELLALQEGGADANRSRYLEHILDAGRHLLSLVDDVLDLQRVQERKVPLAPRALDLSLFIAAETALLGPMLARQNLTMHNEVPQGIVVYADERCLRHALFNLGTNAIKYNRPSGVVRWTASVIRSGFAVLMLSDTGLGISREQIPRLFQPFDRLGKERSALEGSGLGLLIARGLIEHMGGRLDVESGVGVGTQVLVELPLAEPHSLFGDLEAGSEHPGAAPAPERAATGAAQVGAQSNLMPTLRLLYVEDNRINAMLFEAVLGARPDIELRIAETGWEALDIVETWVPDVLVLDANLPDIHGIRLLRQMREFEPLKSTPAYMCSADAMEEDIQLARDAGFRDYWTKPIDFNKVLADLRGLARSEHGSENP